MNIFLGYAIVGFIPVLYTNLVLENAELGYGFLALQLVCLIIGVLKG
jgi:hypothetical protein